MRFNNIAVFLIVILD